MGRGYCKPNQNDQNQYKVCFVAKANSQQPDIDYHETFSPNEFMTSIWILMKLTVR